MFKYNPVEQTKKRASVWPYLVIISGVLQLILVLYILFLMTIAMNSDQYSPTGAAISIAFSSFPLFTLALINFLGLPFYIKYSKPKGFRLILVCISWSIALFVFVYSIWTIMTL